MHGSLQTIAASTRQPLPIPALAERVSKPMKSKKQIAALLAAELNAIGNGLRAMPPLIDGHIRDGMGRNWDVVVPARTPAHRKAVDRIRDLYDLA
jgi:hypothetical protein